MIVEVAAGVLQRPDGSFLLGQRPAGKVYAGYWEFPGGKVEKGEQPVQALARELHEELGIDVQRAYPWITREFTYPHATVRLDFFRVTEWRGEPHPREQQAIAWQRMGQPLAEPMLPANAPVLAALALPTEYAVTQAAALGVAAMLERLERRLEQGLKLLQVREPGLPKEERDLFTRQAIGLAHRHGCKVLVKTASWDPSHPSRSRPEGEAADGIHLTAAELMAARFRPAAPVVCASCHTREELEQAMRLQLDFAVAGPVKPTASHHGAPGMGWEGFSRLVERTTLPVYAIGGLVPADLESAWAAGAHGIAMIRGSWRET